MPNTDTAPGLTAEQLNLLLSPLHPSRVRQLSGQSHLEAWDVRRWLTRIFGFCGWSDEILSCELVHEQTWPVMNEGKPVPGKNRCTAVYRVTLRLTVKDSAGRVLGSWDDAATGDSVNQPSVGDAHDMALKTAVSQALKRCAVNLGDQFGLSLYNKGATGAVIVRTAAHPGPVTAAATVPQEDAPVDGGELDESREGEPQSQVADAVARKAQRERRSAPVDDEFTVEPPAAPKPSTQGQRTKLVILAGHKRGVTGAPDRHRLVGELLGRQIGSFKDLTFTEAHRLIDLLDAEPDHIADAELIEDTAPVVSGPNPRNGDGPQLPSALFVPPLGVLVQHAKEPDGPSVHDQLVRLVADATDQGVLKALFGRAVAARDAGHISAAEFGQLDEFGRAANEDLAKRAADPSWAARGMAAMEAKAAAS